MKRFLPSSLAGQLITLLLLALIVAQGVSLVVLLGERQRAVLTAVRGQVLARTAAVVRLLNDTPAGQHARIIESVTTPRLRFWIADTSAVDGALPAYRDQPLARQLTQLLQDDLRGPALVQIEEGRDHHMPWHGEDQRRAWRPFDDDEDDDDHEERDFDRDGDDHHRAFRMRHALSLTISAPLKGGRWLNVATAAPAPSPAWAWPSLVSMGLMALAILTIVFVMVRRITRPLQALAAAADGLGRGEQLAPLALSGPDEVRRTTGAFNAMDARIRRFVGDRTRMLAAISHDLRTPITTLRLRAEFIEDGENRTKILETLDEMQRMTEAALAFAREEATPEKTRRVDLAALIQSLCDDLAELGRDVAFEGPGRTPYAGRPAGLKRALRNMIENAGTYGRRARVSLATTAEGLDIIIDDDGPGIPEQDRERVFEPFVRLEESRSPETGGIGLGMAIARSIVRGHGGDITLDNRAGGGLGTVIHLPTA
jgi:signal transduction histidine kinase